MVQLSMRLPKGLVATPPKCSAIYFLFRSGIVVYIGSSKQPAVRVKRHGVRNLKSFDSIRYLPCEEPKRLELEKHWIAALRPVHNKRCNPKPNGSERGWGADDRYILVAFRLLPKTIKQMDNAAARLGWSRAWVIRTLIQLHADKLHARSTPQPSRP